MANKKSTKRSLAMKKRWAERRQRQHVVTPQDVACHNSQAAVADPESVKLYEARREGRREAFEDSLDGIVQEREELIQKLKNINNRIAHRRIELGLD